MQRGVKLLGVLCALRIVAVISPGSAQIVPDNTLGSERSIVVPGPSINGQSSELLTGGALHDENLFHSFEEFNVLDGRAAFFQSNEGVSRIFSRVTGNNISQILGTLGVLGTGDLIFINDRGIFFGPDAALALEGSFIGATASTIQFADGSVFSSDVGSSPLLTNSIPVGLGFNRDSSIIVQDAGRGIVESFTAPFGEIASQSGLSVMPGQTLALLGGEVTFEGGIIRAPDAQVEVSSVSEGIVNLASTPVWTFDYGAVTAFGDLQLAQLSLIDASGLSGGQIRLRGAGISSSDGSVVLTRNLGGPSRGSIDVVADEIAIGDSALEEPVITPFLTQNIGTGEGANIRVLTQEISLQNGGWISTNTFTDGSSGDIKINASESIGVRGFNSLEESFVSNILALTSGSGDAGGIKLTSRELSVQEGAVVISITIGPAANAGTVEIDADGILVDGGLPNLEVPSLIGSFTLGFGNSDQLRIRADSIRVLNGGTIFTSTIGSGNAGDTTIQARDFIEVSGELPGGINPSSIASSATLANPIVQNLLTLAQAPLPENLPDFLSPLAGDAGSISVETPDLTIQDGGIISVQNDGTGDAGIISVSSDNIRLLSSGAMLAATNSGDGGNINLSSDTLLLNQSSISSAASGNGSGGNIAIGNDVTALIDNSQITANAQLGSGGQVEITTTGLFQDPSSTITATSAAGPQLDGSVLIQSPEVDLSRAGTLDVPAIQPPQTTSICAGRQDAGRSEFVVTGTGGIPISPDTLQRSYSGWNDAESPIAPDTLLSEVTPSKIVEAQGFAFNPDGTFSLALVADNAVLQAESGHRQNCLSEALGDS